MRELQRAARWLPSDLARRYARAYGSRVERFLLGARGLGDLGERLGEGCTRRRWTICGGTNGR